MQTEIGAQSRSDPRHYHSLPRWSVDRRKRTITLAAFGTHARWDYRVANCRVDEVGTEEGEGVG